MRDYAFVVYYSDEAEGWVAEIPDCSTVQLGR